MKKKEAIEYLDKLSDELNDLADNQLSVTALLAGMTFGVTHALMVLGGDTKTSDPHEDALVMVTNALMVFADSLDLEEYDE